MRRRLLLLLLALALVAAACGGGGDGDGGADGGGDGDGADAAALCPVDALDAVTEPVQITYWTGALNASLADAMDTLVKSYNDSQDKVRVDVQAQGTYDENAEKYLTALRGGDLPELILLEETRLQLMIDSQSVVPAEACIEAADYDLSDHLPVVIDQFTVEDQLWPMPFNVSNPVLYYDTNDFVAAGLDPADPPSTLEEVLEASRAIKSSGAAKYGFAFETSAWFIEQMYAKAGAAIVDHDNGRTGRAEEATLASDAGEEIFGFLEQLFAEDLAFNVGRNETGTDALLALGNGDAAMTLGTSAALSSIYDIQAAGQFTDVGVGVGPLPGPEAEDGGVLVGGGANWIVGKGKSDAEKAAAWDFARWLNEPQQQALWHSLSGYIPIRQSSIELPEVADLWSETPTYRVAYDQLLGSNAEIGGPAIGPYKEFRDSMRNGLEALVLKGTPADEVIAQIEREGNEAIQSYNERIGD